TDHPSIRGARGLRVTGHDSSQSDMSKNQDVYKVDCIIGAAMLVPRSTFEKVGGMDEDFFFFLEETDWCKRIKQAGLNVLHFSDIIVTHLQGKTANTLPVKARIEFHRSRLHYFKKHHGIITAVILWIGCLIRLIINFTVMLFLTLLTFGQSGKLKNKMKLYGNVLLWYLCACPKNWGLK
ncbi:glycosyltransferase family 2 protein, partial [bacterium]|nr:glycosyltransferase family 2 protein [bacterium]